MSVITSLPATPNRLRIIWSYLRSAGPGGIDAEELQRLLGPRALQSRQAEDEDERSGTTIVDHVVSEMRNLGLLHRVENGSIALAPEVPDGDEAMFLAYMECRLLDPIEAEKYGQRAFPRALAWFLVQDPATPLEWGQNYGMQVENDCGGEVGAFELTNHSRFEQFVYWARYLGFAWRLEIQGANVIFPDPTSAIARHLVEVVSHKERQRIQDVISGLARRLPVLEGGTVREEVESRLPLEKQRPDGQLSRSTSLALERMESRGQLILERLDDALAVILDRASGPRPVSHVTWRDGE